MISTYHKIEINVTFFMLLAVSVETNVKTDVENLESFEKQTYFHSSQFAA
jgi:hypothetical protein